MLSVFDSPEDEMATPYLQIKLDEVPSTQDVARSEFSDLPVVVIAARQTAGRGRTGSTWDNAPRAVAVSIAGRVESKDSRPFSLIAGVAASRALGDEIQLKWPNDVLVGEGKAGGILVERSDDVLVVGFGLNLWWPDAPAGMGALHSSDPGPESVNELGALWAAEFLALLDEEGWPLSEYEDHCSTLGMDITWEPASSGHVLGIAANGGLKVKTGGVTTIIRSGAVRHVRKNGS